MSSIGTLAERGIGIAIKAVFALARWLLRDLKRRDEAVLIISPGEEDLAAELLRRAAFYIPEHKVIQITMVTGEKKAGLKEIFSKNPYLTYGGVSVFPRWAGCRGGVFDLDYTRNPYDGWTWHQLSEYLARPDEVRLSARYRLAARVEALRRQGLEKSYVFGTGPSLEKARSREWSDGYRVVCNTIVRDKEMWNHLQPQVIVAADAIYHFGHTSFAKAFRRDLRDRLKETDTLFIYDELFHPLMMREFGECRDQLIPMPTGTHTVMHVDLAKKFSAPLLGNVLLHLLLPVACTLTREVCLIGFDGRAPDDKLFWSNSSRHTYAEHMEDLCHAHPCFFDFFVPKSQPEKYVSKFHGDLLEDKLRAAEEAGWYFVMMHKSWTETLNSRYVPGLL